MTQVTQQQVAEKAGVSPALVSLVMRGAPNVSDHRRRLVLEAAAELGYRPNVLARSLASRRTHTIGVVVNDLHNPFFAEVADGIQAAADEADYRLLFGNGRHSPEGEAVAVETFLEFRVDGVIVAGTLELASIEEAARAVPLVVVARSEHIAWADTINTDNEAGAHLMVDHLVAAGHRRIAHIDGGGGAGAAHRSIGYVDAMRRHGLDDHIQIAAGDFTEDTGRAGAAELLDRPRPPTAIFAANDLSAIGAFDETLSRGMRIPDDVSIGGYDNIGLAAMAHLGLTTINQPSEDIGAAALDMLLQRVETGRDATEHVVLQPELVVRTSSGPPPGDPT
ncbi:MAG: LacI family DNA-binding transcriptional regulator [Actinomycetota bacterium]